jgi:hypothetical protein
MIEQLVDLTGYLQFGASLAKASVAPNAIAMMQAYLKGIIPASDLWNLDALHPMLVAERIGPVFNDLQCSSLELCIE